MCHFVSVTPQILACYDPFYPSISSVLSVLPSIVFYNSWQYFRMSATLHLKLDNSVFMLLPNYFSLLSLRALKAPEIFIS
jgi:hypothetical protein